MKLFLKIANTACLYVLVFSITFENWDPFQLAGTYSVTYLTSILYLGTWIPLLSENFHFNHIKKYVVPLLLFILMGLIATAINSHYAEELKDAYNYRVLLLVILMSFISCHLLNDRSLLLRTMYIYIASILLMYFLVIAGQGVSYENGRVMLFGENPNMIGMKAVIAFLIIMANFLDSIFTLKRLVLTILLSIPLLSLVLMSVSRGAFLSVFIGLVVLIMFKKTSVLKKFMLNIFLFLISAFFFVFIMPNNEILQRRLLNTLESGDFGRNELWLGALQIIENNIFFGVGFPGVLPEMLKHAGRFIDPHNVYLYVWISSGMIGFAFFILFLIRLMKGLFDNYKLTGKTIFIVIFVIILFNMSKAGGGINKILFWFMFAILISSTSIDSFPKKDLIKYSNK